MGVGAITPMSRRVGERSATHHLSNRSKPTASAATSILRPSRPFRMVGKVSETGRSACLGGLSMTQSGRPLPKFVVGDEAGSHSL